MAGQVNAAIYWNEIQASVGQRVQTQTLYEILTAAHYQATGELGSFNFGQVTQLRSLAARNRNASENFADLPLSGAVGPEHIGAVPNAPFGGVPREAGRVVIRFEQNIIRNGVPTTEIRSNIYSTGIPSATKSGIMNRLNRDAATLASEYDDETHVSIGQVWILAA